MAWMSANASEARQELPKANLLPASERIQIGKRSPELFATGLENADRALSLELPETGEECP